MFADFAKLRHGHSCKGKEGARACGVQNTDAVSLSDSTLPGQGLPTKEVAAAEMCFLTLSKPGEEIVA